jgi:hypothetical protein
MARHSRGTSGIGGLLGAIAAMTLPVSGSAGDTLAGSQALLLDESSVPGDEAGFELTCG